MSRVIADGLSEKARAAFATSAQGDTADSALQDAAAFATAAQGNTADSALQAVTKADIDALNVDADTLDGQHASAFATAAQGNTADSALQAEHRKTGQLALTRNAVLTWNHNEGAVPDHAWASLVCVTAEHGYSVGDETDQWAFYEISYDYALLGSPSVVKSANKVQLPLGNRTPRVVRLVASLNADQQSITRSSWRIKFHAIWYN